MFFDGDNSFYVQRNHMILNKRITNELKLIDLLIAYGAKFSDLNVVLYDVDLLFEMLKKHSDVVHLPTSLFHPDDHVSFGDITIQPDSIVPIEVYLKCLVHVLKLNLPTLHLKTVASTSKSSTSILNRKSPESYYYDVSNFNSSSSNTEKSQEKEEEERNTRANKDKFYDFKINIEACLKQLVDFVQDNVIDSFERDFYYSYIHQAFEFLSKYYQ